MNRNELIDTYFKWMYQLVCNNERYSKTLSYRKLLRYLHSIDFQYSIPMDGNRADDGVNLRYRFADEKRYKHAMITLYLNDRPCSVLEMMIALSIRCEEHIMDDPDVGNRTGQWFWEMIVNLGLGCMSDDRFDEDYIDGTIECFLNRDYAINGKGGLFTVENYKRDMRTVEIWYQMCWYLVELDQKGALDE